MAGPLAPSNTAPIISKLMDEGAHVDSSPQPVTPSHKPMHIALAGMGAGQAADALTTILALRRPGAYEANSAYGGNPSAAKIAGVKAAGMVPLAILLDKVYNKHPKVAMGSAIGLGAFGAGLAARNSRQGR